MNDFDHLRNEILKLKNLGPVTADMLAEIGISSREDMADFGAVNLYRLLISKGYKLSKVAVYAFEGAIQDIHWNKLSEQTMDRLNEELATTK